jgi:hypothetical protein
MKFRMRTWATRFNDLEYTGDIRSELGPNPKADDGLKTVIITGRRTAHLSPKVRWPHAELWGVTRCNTFYWREALTDWDRWFDLHPVASTEFHKGILAKRPEAWDWYTRQRGGRPIYLLETHPDVPDSVAFPRAAVQAHFQTTQFTVSVDWMIAFAMMQGYQRIVLNGIGTRMEPTYQYAHKGILYWIGRAQGAGLDLVIEGPSCYRAPEKVYGYETGAPVWTAKETACLANV